MSYTMTRGPAGVHAAVARLFACTTVLVLVLVPGLALGASDAAQGASAESAPGATAGDRPSAEVRLVERDHPLVGRIWSTREARFVAESDVLAAAARSRFVLLGERHGNPEHHALQARLVTAAAAGGRALAVVAEQLDFAQQAAIDACVAGCTEFGTELGARVGWERTGWPPYVLYAPVFEAAHRAGATVLAGNPSAARIRALSRGEPAAPDEGWAAAAREPLSAAGRERLVQDLVDGHCGHLPAERTEPLVHAQRLRDAAMAATLLRGAAAGADRAGVLIAGNGHARRDYGVPTLLGDTSALVIGFMEVAANERSAANYAEPGAFDYLWFTARVDEPDPCEQFREHLRKLAPR
jgi:uncharacterized iron-regulated protein